MEWGGEPAARPALSLITPVWDGSNPAWLRALGASIAAQSYRGLEWVCVSDGVQERSVRAALQWVARRCRARVVDAPRVGLTAATAAGVAAARHEWLLFVDGDDLLEPEACASFAGAIATQPDLALVYSDMDHMDARGRRYGPVIKPGPSPELALGKAYSCHLHAVRRGLFERIDPGARLEGALDWQLLIRALEEPQRVARIPQILYSWRQHASSVSASGAERLAALHRECVAQHLRRRQLGDDYGVESLGVAGCVRIVSRPRRGPLLTLVVHGREAEEWSQRLRARHPSAAVSAAGAWAGAVGAAALAARTPYVALVGAGIDVERPGALWGAVGLLERAPGVGLVGGKLLDRRRRVLHAGYGLDRDGRCVSLQVREPEAWRASWEVRREVLAVSGALCVVRRSVLEEVGLDGTLFPSDGWDVDLCLRAGAQGQRAVYDPRMVGVEVLPRPRVLSDPVHARLAAAHGTLRDPYAVMRGELRTLVAPWLFPVRGWGSRFLRGTPTTARISRLGGVPERSNGLVSKTSEGASLPGVQIPPPPFPS